MHRALLERYPYAHCELDFETPLQLLVATVLSAQTTDVMVNTVTPTLFSRWPTAEAPPGPTARRWRRVLRPDRLLPGQDDVGHQPQRRDRRAVRRRGAPGGSRTS